MSFKICLTKGCIAKNAYIDCPFGIYIKKSAYNYNIADCYYSLEEDHNMVFIPKNIECIMYNDENEIIYRVTGNNKAYNIEPNVVKILVGNHRYSNNSVFKTLGRYASEFKTGYILNPLTKLNETVNTDDIIISCFNNGKFIESIEGETIDSVGNEYISGDVFVISKNDYLISCNDIKYKCGKYNYIELHGIVYILEPIVFTCFTTYRYGGAGISFLGPGPVYIPPQLKVGSFIVGK